MRASDLLLHGAATDHGHRVVDLAGGEGAELVDGHDIGMGEMGRDLRFFEEALAPRTRRSGSHPPRVDVGSVVRGRVQELHRDGTAHEVAIQG